MGKKRIRETIAGYGFLTPSLISMSLFVILPIILLFYYSFTNYKGGPKYDFVGLKNFVNVFSDTCFDFMIKNTFILVCICVPIIVLLSLGLAVILAQYFQGSRFGNLSKAIFFIPSVCADTIIAQIWKSLFAHSDYGVVNSIVRFFGGDMVDWLGTPATAVFVICFVKTWINFGYFLIIFYAGIMDIPKSHLEAATIDGAGKFQQFRYIILPELRHVTYFVVSINIIWAFQVYNLIQVMTGGGPAFATTTLIFRIKNLAFNDWRLGYACAMSILAFVLIFVTTRVVNLLKSKDDDD